MGVLHQFKPTFTKKKVDFAQHGINTTAPRSLLNLQPGDNRPDNLWMQYADTDPITCDDDLERAVFVDKTHWGYQTWPVKLEVLSHERDFYTRCRTKDTMCAEEMVILETFTNSDYLEKFFKFLSIEVKKGEDRFHHIHYIVFKALFRNYGRVLLDSIRPSVEDMLSENIESKHRCAAEVISGLIRGSKHWNYGDLTVMWNFLLPLLRDTFASNIMQETVKDWSLALIVSTVRKYFRAQKLIFFF